MRVRMYTEVPPKWNEAVINKPILYLQWQIKCAVKMLTALWVQCNLFANI